MEFGRATLNEKLHLRSQVVSGGAVGPGSIYEYADYNGSKRISHSEDDRSGSKRSGSVVFHLSPNKLYALKNIAYNSSRSANYFLSTFGEEPTLFDTEDDFEAERARVFPLGKIASDEADERAAQQEVTRIKRETEEAETRRIAAEALKEINAERAAEIEKNGQPKIEGFPTLTGSPKQIAYAVEIRKAYANKNPSEKAIKTATTAKYWIENHRSALYR